LTDKIHGLQQRFARGGKSIGATYYLIPKTAFSS
jgi:hypothetical protein